MNRQLHKDFKYVLARSSYFQSHSQLVSLFTDSRISFWKDAVPRVDSVNKRVASIVSMFHNQTSTRYKKNVLYLFLLVLLDNTMPEQQLYIDIQNLSVAWDNYLELNSLDNSFFLEDDSTSPPHNSPLPSQNFSHNHVEHAGGNVVIGHDINIQSIHHELLDMYLDIQNSATKLEMLKIRLKRMKPEMEHSSVVESTAFLISTGLFVVTMILDDSGELTGMLCGLSPIWFFVLVFIINSLHKEPLKRLEREIHQLDKKLSLKRERYDQKLKNLDKKARSRGKKASFHRVGQFFAKLLLVLRKPYE